MERAINRPEPKLNAYKHGLTAQTLLLDPADKPAYDEHCKSYFDLYKPVGRPEQILVHMIADDYWRCLRGRAMESAVMSRSLDRSILKLEHDEEKKLYNLSIYVQRIERSIRNDTKALKEMQNDRKQADTAAATKEKPEFVFSQPKEARPVEQTLVCNLGFSPGDTASQAAQNA